MLIHNQAVENYGIPLTNIVYMGMGEPLLNYANMMKSIEMITSEEGLNMSAKRITVSTAGIAKMIRKLGVGDHIDPVDPFNARKIGEHIFDHRLARYWQQWFRLREREWIQSRGVARGKNDNVHV